MTYKDPDKQRKANKSVSRRRRDRRKGLRLMAKGMTKVLTQEGMTQGFTLNTVIPNKPPEGVTKTQLSSMGDSDIGVVKALHKSLDKPPEVIDGKYNREYLPCGIITGIIGGFGSRRILGSVKIGK